MSACHINGNYDLLVNLDHCSSFGFRCTTAAAAAVAAAAAATAVIVTWLQNLITQKFHVRATHFSLNIQMHSVLNMYSSNDFCFICSFKLNIDYYQTYSKILISFSLPPNYPKIHFKRPTFNTMIHTLNCRTQFTAFQKKLFTQITYFLYFYSIFALIFFFFMKHLFFWNRKPRIFTYTPTRTQT